MPDDNQAAGQMPQLQQNRNPRMIWRNPKPGELWGAIAPQHLRVSPVIRAEQIHNDEGLKGRRIIPEGSGAVACWGGEWARIIELLADPIGDACPWVMHRSSSWVLRARYDGNSTTFAEHGLVTTPTFQDKLSPCRAAWGCDWVKLMDIIHPEIAKSVPEIRFGKAPFCIPRARMNGMRIEFFDKEDVMLRRVLDTRADLADGHPIPRTSRIWIEFFDDDGRIADRVQTSVIEAGIDVNPKVQIHGGRLDWM